MTASDFMAAARERLTQASEHDVRGEEPLLDTPGPQQIRHAAVAVLFSMHQSRPSILMIRRSARGGQHRTEWAFPGGIVESDDATFQAAALRETEEELGVAPDLIDIWGPLPSVVTGTGYEVWPFTGRLQDDVTLTPEVEEVDDVTYFPVEVLASAGNHRSITLVRGDTERVWDAIAYEGRIVWGASARIINRVVSILDDGR